MGVTLANGGFPDIAIDIFQCFDNFTRPTEDLLVRGVDVIKKHPPFPRKAACKLHPKEIGRPPRAHAYDAVLHSTLDIWEAVGSSSPGGLTSH